MKQKLTPEQKAKRRAQIEKELEVVKAKEKKLDIQLKSVIKQQKEYEKKNKLLFFNDPDKGYLGKHGKWESNPTQKKYFEALKNPLYKILGLVGGNRTAKTFSSTGVTALTGIKGCFPWEDPNEVGTWFWNNRGWEPPIKIRIVGQDWEKHIKTVIVATIKELWPASWGFDPRKNGQGVEANWTHPAGTIEILSNSSESSVFEGWNGHIVIYDEPPKRENRIACARGLVDYQGIEIFAMTLLKEAWIDQDVVNGVDKNGQLDKSTIFFTSDIQDNVGFGITQEGVDQFAKTLTEDEKSARLRGVPSYKSGIILNMDREIHVVERNFEIPSSWMVDVAIDIGIQKAHDILYLATSPDGRKYVCFEETVSGNGDIIAESIIQKKNRYMLRINRVICDPLAKGNTAGQDFEHSTWSKIDAALNRFDMYLEAGSKLKNDGVITINSLLMTVNKIPMLFFFRDLGKTVKQCLNWMYDKEGKPSKKDDDMCENLYRLALLETEWEEPDLSWDSLYSDGSNERDPVTGY